MDKILILSWNVSPEIFRLGGFSLRYYSVAFMLAILAAYMVLDRVFRQERVPPGTLDRLLVYMVTGTLLGARLGHCLFYEAAYYKTHPWEIFLPVAFHNGQIEFTGYEGLASHGAAIGMLLAAWRFSIKYRLSLTWILDRLAIIVPLAGSLIRIGNFFNAEIIGVPSTLPWAVIFTRVDAQPRHPAQLYEAFCYALIFCWQRYRYYQAPRPGQLFGSLLLLVFTTRFCIEFVKENQVAFENGHLLNMGQILSLPLVFLGIYFLKFYKVYGER
ncbi:prolipoprotein diacylglyceryl transferase [Chitinophaga polysaccharea]|uniref:prolipoprotein diacylglyceryl transferase n=1 Tax=Chitinophaga polysaccharea TaxID=1293035 RepID=UPI001455519C|nr:prolipoprotein diacylglyceryl transferase [Chitinophaga polysaccharea]NLR59081.1 prolipoprotein diacylglyceryl transferase [Chitinophaga polysaccharea]